MNIFLSLVKKESLSILRDPRTILINLLMPIVLLVLFGFAISNEVNSVRIAAVVTQHTPQTREILERLRVNRYFDFKGLTDPADIDPLMRSGRIDGAVILRPVGNELESQIIVDASNATIAQSSVIYIRSVLNQGAPGMPVNIRTLYNPQLKSSYNFVPGIMGMIFILICAIMTSVAIVSEKESGTMDLLTVSPVRPATIILGKLLPYFVMACIILAVMLLMAYTVLGLPPTTQIVHVVWISIVYVILSLSIGMLISTVAKDQVTALMMSAMMFMVPVVMFSGMMFPIDNMPLPLQWLSCIIPARWYISAIRQLMIQQLPISYVTTEIAVLCVMTLFCLLLAVRKMTKD